jgi:hypothetical protein
VNKHGWAAAALAVAISTLWSAPSNALTYTFSFDSGTVTGEIDGLFANGTNEKATHVYLESYPNVGLSFTVPFDMVPSVDESNSFDVNAAGQITDVFFQADDGQTTYDFCLSYGKCNPASFLYNWQSQQIAGASDLSFTLVSATPLPATLPLFAGGLGFVGYLTRRRKQNSKQALAAA